MTDLLEMMISQQLMGDFPDKVKPRRLGDTFYYHQGFTDKNKIAQNNGVYLPTHFLSEYFHILQSAKSSASGLIIKDSLLLKKEVLRNAEQIVTNLMRLAFYSPAVDYGNSWITGDVGEIRTIKIDFEQKEVLVIPQGMLRAKVNAANFDACNMIHPLANDTEEMLKIMALTMYKSGFKTPYFRGKGIADSGNDAALSDEVLSSTFLASTWDFFGKPSYALSPKEKWLIVSPHALEGHPLSQYKVSGTYQRRLNDRQELIFKQERGKNFSRNVAAKYDNDISKFALDTCYFLPNGMIADAMCQNIGFLVKNNSGNMDLIFVKSSNGTQDNYFFVGKTQKTLYDIINKQIDLEGITVKTISSAKEFAVAVEGNDSNTYKFSGSGLITELNPKLIVYDALKKVQGMVVLGTFRGMELVQGILPEERYGNEIIQFPWPVQARKTFEKIQSALWNTVYGLNGGTKLTADLNYCTMFDTVHLTQGIAHPLNLEGKCLE